MPPYVRDTITHLIAPLLERCSNQRDTLAHFYFMPVEKIFVDELNEHSLKCHLNDKGRCFIECRDINTEDIYYRQYVTLDLETLSELISDLTEIKKQMEALKDGHL